MEIFSNFGDLQVIPEEILIYILEHIPNRWNLSLVNWSFYDLVCKIETNQYRLRLIDVSIKCECLLFSFSNRSIISRLMTMMTNMNLS